MISQATTSFASYCPFDRLPFGPLAFSEDRLCLCWGDACDCYPPNDKGALYKKSWKATPLEVPLPPKMTNFVF